MVQPERTIRTVPLPKRVLLRRSKRCILIETGEKTIQSTLANIRVYKTERTITISPFRWMIKARVMNKSPITTWSNSRGGGKLFSMELVDKSGRIRCAAFRKEVDKFYDALVVSVVQLKSATVRRTFFRTFYLIL
jgi:hypothetical protein